MRSITYCPDTYQVTTADGQTKLFWERNLRFKTDSSVIGPEKLQYFPRRTVLSRFPPI